MRTIKQIPIECVKLVREFFLAVITFVKWIRSDGW